MHIMHIHSKYVVQNRALLDTLRIFQSNNNKGHIVLYTTLLIGHTQHQGHMRIYSCPFVPKKLKKSNRQDYVFIRPPGISEGAFQLRMDNIWFCKLYCFLNSIQGQTLACSTWTVPMFLCWKSTGVRGNQVILCIFCIFFIFLL